MDYDEITYHPEINHPYRSRIQSHDPILKVTSGTLKGKQYQLTDEIQIGRDPASDIAIEERIVSRRHAAILKKAGRYLLCDLDSTNGTYVNNLKVKKTVLKDGDIFQIGSCLFQFFWS